MLTLNRKLPIILPAKMDLFGNGRKLQFGTNELWQNQRQVGRARERVSSSGGEGEVGDAVINKNPIDLKWELEV